nr:MAG TPA: ERF superfamily protein [Caudoviricetes sp.]
MEDTIFLQSESKPTTKAEPKKEVKAEKKDYTKMNVYQKLAIARAELGNRPLKKSGVNKYAGYSYFELNDFIGEINKIFKELNLISVFNIKVNDLGVETAFLDIVNADNPTETITFEAGTAEAGMKGATPIQILGAKHTYMRRYLWLEAMEIAENDAQDAIPSNERETTAKAQMATQGQLKIIAQQDPERVKKMLEFYKISEIKDLTMKQASDVIKVFSKDKKEEEKPNE